MNALRTLRNRTRLAARALRARLEAVTRLDLATTLARVVRLDVADAEPVPVPVPVRRPRALAKVLVAAAATTLVATAVRADVIREPRPVPTGFDWSADGRLVEVSVLVDGSTAPLYLKPGAWDRRYFEAFRGRNYALVVRNNSGGRVGVLISVDGLNVVSGERSSLSNREPMYVLDPWESATIRGWRTSLRDVRRFVFVDEERSYAERTGQANGDMGWIRVLSFRESRPLAWQGWDRRFRPGARPFGADEPRAENERPGAQDSREGAERRDAPAPSAGRAEGLKRAPEKLQAGPESNPGTGWGDRRIDPVQRTEFTAVRNPSDRIVLRYEYANGLRALGIFPRRGDRTWERERGQMGFAKPPLR